MIVLSKTNRPDHESGHEWVVHWLDDALYHQLTFATADEGAAFMVRIAIQRRNAAMEAGQ